MTDQELKDIVAAVVAELEKSGVDFDYKIEAPLDTDTIFVIRGTAPNYQGVTVTWKGLLDIITAQATQAKNDAETAKNAANTILEQVQSKGTEITNFVATSKTEIETQKNESVEEVRTVYQGDLNELKGDLTNSKKAIAELDDKKITKFYASNNGNTNLPDSDNGKPSDMKIFGKSIQDGTPSPDAPIEIQSVVNPVVRMMGKNLCLAKDVYAGADSYLETTLDGRECVRFTSGFTVKNKPIEFKENTQYTVSFDLKMVKYISGGFKETVFAFFYTDGSAMYTFADLKDYTIWKRMKITSHANKTVSTIGVYVQDYRTYCYVSNFQFEEGSTATGYVPYVTTSASLPYTLNAIPVSDGGNVTIDGQQYIADYVDVERGKLVKIVDSSKLDNTQSIVNKTEWLLAESQEIGLTQEEVQTLKTLATHYPVTNVFVASSQLDGCAIFNYPLNMANGWNYVMQQIGETRPIIYDTQVKTIENIIDTAILTAMMEA